MVLLTYCIPCQHGDHEHHHKVVQAVPEGMIGGAKCRCEGECVEQRSGHDKLVGELRTMWDDADRKQAARGDHTPCALCDGYGDVVNPGNADPAVKVTDWLPPVGCPRCGQTGKDPNP